MDIRLRHIRYSFVFLLLLEKVGVADKKDKNGVWRSFEDHMLIFSSEQCTPNPNIAAFDLGKVLLVLAFMIFYLCNARFIEIKNDHFFNQTAMLLLLIILMTLCTIVIWFLLYVFQC